MVVLAPISTSSSRITRPKCGTVRNPVSVDAKLNPSNACAGIHVNPSAEDGVGEADVRANSAIGTDHDP